MVVCIFFLLVISSIGSLSFGEESKLTEKNKFLDDSPFLCNTQNGFNEVKFDCNKKQLLKQNPDEKPNNFNYYWKWISPLQDKNSPLTSIETSRVSLKNVNDIPRITYNGNTLYVGGTGSGNYSTISAAFIASKDGDTIYVYEGSYLIWPGLIIDKSIRLLGENPAKTILNGKGEIVVGRPVVTVKADDVTISGFTIQRNLPTSIFLPDIRDCGVWIGSDIQNATVSQNIFSNNVCGIYLGNYEGLAELNNIANNSFNSNIVGMCIDNAYNNVIENNSFFGEGVILTDSSNNRFFNNFVNGKPLVVLEDEENALINEAGQVILISCKNITVTNTNIMGSYVGIWLQDSFECNIIGNHIQQDSNGGIFLEYSNDNMICDNFISTSSIGILLGASHNNTVQSNYLTLNYGISVLVSAAERNIINNNTFVNNALMSQFVGFMLTGGAMSNIIVNNCFINDSLFLNGAGENLIENNSFNGKPLIFLVEASDMLIDIPAGQIILLGCSNIEIRNQSDIDIHVMYSINCLVSNVSFRPEKEYGLLLVYSDFISVSNCIFSNIGYGIYLYGCKDCVFEKNAFTGSYYTCIFLESCTQNIVRENDFRDNGGYFIQGFGGIILFNSLSNLIIENNFIDNYKGYVFDFSCKSNTFNGNYWDRARVFPKILFGIGRFIIPSIAFDWHPAKEPYDIQT